MRGWCGAAAFACLAACGARTSLDDRRNGGTRTTPGRDSPTAERRSCLEVLAAGESLGDGFYVVDWDLTGPAPSIEVYCDMSLAGGGFTRCLSYVNTPAEDVTNNSWFDRCVAWTMSPWTGGEVLVKLVASDGALVYWGTGLRVGEWTYDKLTSQEVPQFQLPGSQVPIVLSTGDLLSVTGRSATNAGCYGGWANGYEVLVSAPPTAEWPFLSVMPYRHQNGGDAGTPRTFWENWFPTNEITFWTDERGLPRAPPDPCTDQQPPGYLGAFEFYVR